MNPEASVEAEAMQVLKDIKEGRKTLHDLLGPLVGEAQNMNPAINLPRGDKTPMPVAPTADLLPADCPFNKSAVAHVGPKDRPNPAPKDKYDLVVVGAGVAGLLSVICAKALGKRAALVERHYMGGDCLNVGCFPSKAIISCARRAHEVRSAAKMGIGVSGEVTVDFPFIMRRMRELRASISPHDGVERYCRDFCDDIFLGHAKFTGPDTVEVDGKTLHFDKAMVATGGSALVPPIPGLCEVGHLTNNNFFNLTELPPRMVLIGAGPIGIEMAQTMARFGSKVTVLEMAPQLLPREDPDAANCVYQALQEEENLTLRFSVAITKVEGGSGDAKLCAPWDVYRIHVKKPSGEVEVVECEALLNATGRAPNVSDLGLDEAGVAYDTRSGVHIDEFFCTTNKNVYACGDVASPFKFTHAADWQARTAIRNMFLGDRTTHDQLLVPWCTYTDPEIAHVGKYEKELTDSGVPFDTYCRKMSDVDRCKCEGVDTGFVKITCAKGTDRILGATIVGPNAGDMISEITVCMTAGVGASRLAGIIHPYPTTAECIRQCAAQFWQRGGLKSPANNLAIEMLATRKASL